MICERDFFFPGSESNNILKLSFSIHARAHEKTYAVNNTCHSIKKKKKKEKKSTWYSVERSVERCARFLHLNIVICVTAAPNGLRDESTSGESVHYEQRAAGYNIMYFRICLISFYFITNIRTVLTGWRDLAITRVNVCCYKIQYFIFNRRYNALQYVHNPKTNGRGTPPPRTA